MVYANFGPHNNNLLYGVDKVPNSEFTKYGNFDVDCIWLNLYTCVHSQVTGDNVCSLTLCDFSYDGENEVCHVNNVLLRLTAVMAHLVHIDCIVRKFISLIFKQPIKHFKPGVCGPACLVS